MESNDSLQLVVKQLQEQGVLNLGKVDNNQHLIQLLSRHVNELITLNFSVLVQILYGMDIPEKKLRMVLAESKTNAGDVIAEMMIERQLQKIESRKRFGKPNEDIPDEERW